MKRRVYSWKMDDWVITLIVKPIAGVLWAIAFFCAIYLLKRIVWWLLPEGRLKTALFVYRGANDPKAPTGSTKRPLDDPTIRFW